MRLITHLDIDIFYGFCQSSLVNFGSDSTDNRSRLCELRVKSIQGFGDIKLVIDWDKVKANLGNTLLLSILENVSKVYK